MYDHLTLISGRCHPELASAISEYLGVPLAKLDVGDFPDGETSVRPNHNVRGRDVFLIQPTGPPARLLKRNCEKGILNSARQPSASRSTCTSHTASQLSSLWPSLK